MPLWAWLWVAVAIVGPVTLWMYGSGWWKNGSQRCWEKMKEKFDG